MSPSGTSAPPPVATGDPRRRVLLLAVTGGLHALLFLLAYALLGTTPRAHAPDEEILAFYRSGESRRLVLVGLYVMPFAGIAFLWFSALLRDLMRGEGREHPLSGVQHASAILYVGLFFVGAAASSVTAVSTEFSRAPLDPMLARQPRSSGRPCCSPSPCAWRRCSCSRPPASCTKPA